MGQNGETNETFKLIVMTTSEAGTALARERIQRLSFLNENKKVAVVLLLEGDDAMEVFMKLQIEFVSDLTWTSKYFVLLILLRDISETCFTPMIPISRAEDLPSCLDKLRQGCCRLAANAHENLITSQECASRCVQGTPLSRDQVNMLTGITSSVHHLARKATEPEGQDQIMDFIGPEDGCRVVSFFVNGPKPCDL